MIKKVEKKHSTEGIMSLMHPVVSEWFKTKFGEVTEAQSMAVPLIHARQSVLVSSPTGSGKTLTAFLSILNELILLSSQGRLEDRIYAVYISPLKALANDINENLIKPLNEISELFKAKGLEPPNVKVAVRTGDTLPSERQRQARSPPHIFITTPESLSLVLSTPVFVKRFGQVEWVILDEVHDVCDSKRGVSLSLSLERLQNDCTKEFTRIGLSATVAPLERVAEYLVGLRNGKPRDVSIIEVYGQRDLDLKVICPVKDMSSLSFEVVNSKMYDMLKEMVEQHKTTLIFTNTRSGAESVVYKLKERGIENIGTHHGSLSRETRLDVETALRSGQLKAVVSSTSLELGIDIGHIDLVVQIGSPKSVAKGLQRIGRSGHRYGGTSKGRIIVFEMDDLVECAVLCRAAHRKMIDRVTIPSNCLDVLAQTLVGMSVERRWTLAEAFAVVKRSYCYKGLSLDEMNSVMMYLGGKNEFEGIYSKLWFDEKAGTFGKKRGSRMIYYLNQGTIPEEADYSVFSERGSLIGSLSEKFVERLAQGDIFVLGGRSYEFINAKGTKVFVKSASGRKPTVPSWTGEMLPRSFDLSVAIAKFRGEMEERLGETPELEIKAWLMREFDVDEGSANTIVNYFKEQEMVAKIPTDSRLVIEGYTDQSGNKSAVFHFPFGRRVNDALSRAYAHALSNRLKTNVTISVTDDSFMLTAPRSFALEQLGEVVRSEDLEKVLKSAVKDSELFHQRFRHTATRAFMVLRNYKGRELSVARQQLRSSRLLDALHEIEHFPVMEETYTEILKEVMDLDHAKEVLTSIEEGQRSLDFLPFSGVPSPFAHNVILVGVSDIVLMEDRSMLLRELHRKVLARVLGEEALTSYQFPVEEVEQYFAAKFPKIASKQEILDALKKTGPMNLFREKGESIYAHSQVPFQKLKGWAVELLKEGKVRSVWIGEDAYVPSEDHALYSCLHRRRLEHDALDDRTAQELKAGQKSLKELVESTRLPKEDVKESLRRLETANEIYRSDMKSEAYCYSLAPTECRPRQESLMAATEKHLAFHAPITVEDVAYEVGIDEADAEQALRELAANEVVISGRFVVGEQQQYMLAKDYLRLKATGQPVFDRETIRAYSERKQFAKVPSIRAFFEKFGEAGMIYDIFQRVEDFDMEEFGQMRSKGEILLGRFVRGRIRYVLAEDAPYYLGVYRGEHPTRYEAEILDTLRRMGSATYQQLAAAVGFPMDAMREYFDSLDRKGYMLRLWDENEYWTSRNVYAPIDIEPETEAPYERVLKRYLKGFGPVTAQQAAAYLDAEPDMVERLMQVVGAKSILVGLERTQMYVLPEEMGELEVIVPPDGKIRILSLYDSYLSDKWTEISSRFGEGWIFPLARMGRIVGMVEQWMLAGSLEVREVQLEEPGLLGPLLESFDESMKFYNALGIDIIRFRRVQGRDVMGLDESVRSQFLMHGFAESNGMLVKGRLVTESFELDELLAVAFSLQNLAPSDKLPDMGSALEKFGGTRSGAEALIRVEKFESPQRMLRRGAVVRGHLIPDRVGNCTMDQAAVFRSARFADLTKDEKLLMRIIRDQQPVRRDRLLDLSPLGRMDTLEAIKSLYESSRVYWVAVSTYVVAKRTKMTRQAAWMSVIGRLFETYGAISAESLAMMLGHEIPMRELRRYLRRLEDEGALVKGFLLKGTGVLYWASKNAFPMLGKAKFDTTFVLSPEDNLMQFLKASFRAILPETGRHVIFEGTRPLGSFVGKTRQGRLDVSDAICDVDCEAVIAEYARTLGLALAEREAGRIPDWEIMEFYQKSHPALTRNGRQT